jgi:hypothetical protein
VPGSERSQGDDCAVATPIAIAAFMVYAGGRTASTRRGEFAWNLLLLRFAYSARSGEGEVRCVETVSGSCLTYSFGKPLQNFGTSAQYRLALGSHLLDYDPWEIMDDSY